MLHRCHNPKHPAYPSHGGRGITVCKAWKSFDVFLEDLGPCPDGYQLGRRDLTKGYDPGNTCWMTRSESQRVRGVGRRLCYQGEEHTVLEWAEKIGVKHDTLRNRLHAGWSVGEALGFERRTRCRGLRSTASAGSCT